MRNIKRVGDIIMKKHGLFGVIIGSIVILGIVVGSVMKVNADDMTDVTSSLTTDNRQVGTNSSLGTITYPTIQKVLANYAVDGKITKRTTVFQVTYGGKFAIGSAYRIKTIYPSFVNTTQIKQGANLLTQLGIATSSTYTLDLDNITATSTLTTPMGTGNSWYLGFAVFEKSQVNGNRVGIAKIPDPIAYPLQPTIDGDAVKDNTTVITGKGTFSGDTIKSDVSDATTKVGTDLTYSLDVGSSLSGKDSVTVTETGTSNDTPGTATATVSPAIDLDINSTNLSLQLTPDNITDLATKSDSDVISWLVDQAGITAVDKNTNTADGITFASDQTDLATKINQLTDDGTLTVPIYAIKDGVKSSAVDVVISKSAGSLNFGTISDKATFKTMAAPITATMVPTTNDWQINIDDSRKAGSNWSVYATASKMQSGTHALAGDVVYVDGDNKSVMTDKSILIKDGTRQSGTTTTNIASDWSDTKGIFLDVQPGIYVGDYQGTINWSLQDTATN